ELFGHARGAFTGAAEARPGLIESARAGTLFLDEIGDASAGFQTSLLRLLETGEFRAVGSDRIVRAETTFVAAAQPGIHARVAERAFRLDLWNRLARWVIEVPPLRARREDIGLLASVFARRQRGDDARLATPLVAAMTRHGWPGNVRQLQSFVERLAVTTPPGETLTLTPWAARALGAATDLGYGAVADVGAGVLAEDDAASAVGGGERSRRGKLPRPSREQLDALLGAHGGSVRAVARELDVARRTVYRWIEALELDPDAYRG
ncbi:MAG: sigma-54-dependent Fis family transcriptional regulator, partial [Myxococcales bacterium]|nr:sigma-54-dependent Fis family transcriptional regulator [Myxococcales bacterium]